jgi:hypothetical protein
MEAVSESRGVAAWGSCCSRVAVVWLCEDELPKPGSNLRVPWSSTKSTTVRAHSVVA